MVPSAFFLPMPRDPLEVWVNYFSCLPCGLFEHEPVDDEPQYTHLLAPLPCLCFLKGLLLQEPYELEPQKAQCFSSSSCSCFLCGLFEQDPYEDDPQNLHFPVIAQSPI